MNRYWALMISVFFLAMNLGLFSRALATSSYDGIDSIQTNDDFDKSTNNFIFDNPFTTISIKNPKGIVDIYINHTFVFFYQLLPHVSFGVSPPSFC